MIRASLMLLCLILAAAAAGRYRAEVAARETRSEIRRLQADKRQALDDIQLLRAEIAYLESPERLAGLAARYTSLEPLTGAQLLTAREFLVAFAADGAPVAANAPARDIPEKVDVADLGAPAW